MSQVLKYEMKCEEEDCGKVVIVLTKHDEIEAPNICPFCGSISFEVTAEDK